MKKSDSVFLAQKCLGFPDNFLELYPDRSVFGFGYIFKHRFCLPFVIFPSRPFSSAELNHCIVLMDDALVNTFSKKTKRM